MSQPLLGSYKRHLASLASHQKEASRQQKDNRQKSTLWHQNGRSEISSVTINHLQVHKAAPLQTATRHFSDPPNLQVIEDEHFGKLLQTTGTQASPHRHLQPNNAAPPQVECAEPARRRTV
jgi:hypothetical protein